MSKNAIRVLCLELSTGREVGTEGDKIRASFGFPCGAEKTSGVEDEELLACAGLAEGLLSFSASFDRLEESNWTDGSYVTNGADGEKAVVPDVSSPSTSACLGDSYVMDLGDAFWVACRLSLHPKFVVCLIMGKDIVSRHVADRNLAGLGRLVDDMSSALGKGVQQLEKLVPHVGRVLSNPMSWLRRQLRNPFALTHGASMACLPSDVVSSLRGVAQCFGVRGLGLWRGGLCCFSSFLASSIEVLGSFVLGEGVSLLFDNTIDGDTTTRVLGTVVLEEPEGTNEVAVLRVDRHNEYTIFVTIDRTIRGEVEPTSQVDQGDTPIRVAQEAVRIVQDFVASSGGWQCVDTTTRHVVGSRYCVEDANAGLITCSPRGKVSSSSHHVRSLATTMKNSMATMNSSRGYTCDKTGQVWGCHDESGGSKSLSVTVGGLSVIDFRTLSRAHATCQKRHHLKHLDAHLDHCEDDSEDHRSGSGV